MANEVYQPQESETTVPEMTELTAQELSQQDPKGLETLLYIIRGLGIDRDRFMTLAEFAAFIGSVFNSLKVYTAEGQKTVMIENGEISGYNNINRLSFVLSWLGFNINGDGFTFKANDDGLEFYQEGARFKACETYFEYAKGDDKIYFDADGFKVTKGNISVAVNSSGLVVKNGSDEVFKVENGVVEKLTYKAVGGIIDKFGESSISLDEIPEVLAVGHVPGAVVRLYVSANTKIYFYAGHSDYLKVGNNACVVEFVNFDTSGIYSARNAHYLNPTVPNWNWQQD